MTTQTYWHAQSSIWIINHAGLTELHDLQQIADATQTALEEKESLCILIDLTDIMYSEDFLKHAYNEIYAQEFLNTPKVKRIAFVIPSAITDPLRKAVEQRQEAAGRAHKTVFYKDHGTAVQDLAATCTDNTS